MKYSKSIILKKGNQPGKTLAVFAGVHGNEKVGVKALEMLLPKIKIESGKVYFVFANPKAIRSGIRKTQKDLNRSFISGKTGKTYEDRRARLLMRILKKSDALLDLHAFRYKTGSPFIICEKDSYDLGRRMGFRLVSSGWDKFDIGSTDGYMRSLGKPAMCLELGPVSKTSKYLPLAIGSIMQFLRYNGVISGRDIVNRNKKQIYIKLIKRIYKNTDNFSFSKNYKTGDRLRPYKIFAKDGKKIYRSGKYDYILFPDNSVSIGDEVCLISEQI